MAIPAERNQKTTAKWQRWTANICSFHNYSHCIKSFNVSGNSDFFVCTSILYYFYVFLICIYLYCIYLYNEVFLLCCADNLLMLCIWFQWSSEGLFKNIGYRQRRRNILRFQGLLGAIQITELSDLTTAKKRCEVYCSIMGNVIRWAGRSSWWYNIKNKKSTSCASVRQIKQRTSEGRLKREEQNTCESMRIALSLHANIFDMFLQTDVLEVSNYLRWF